MWALDQRPHDERQLWADSLALPLPGDPFEVADAAFDDSYEQINQ